MTAKRLPFRPHAPFQPGLSKFAYRSDGAFVSCGMCAGRLELRSITPAIIEHQGQCFRRWDYQCADHAPFGGQSYFQATTEPDDAAA